MPGILTVAQQLGAPFSTPTSRPASPSEAQNSKAKSQVPQGGEGRAGKSTLSDRQVDSFTQQ